MTCDPVTVLAVAPVQGLRIEVGGDLRVNSSLFLRAVISGGSHSSYLWLIDGRPVNVQGQGFYTRFAK